MFAFWLYQSLKFVGGSLLQVANKDLPKAYRDTIRVDTLASTAEDGAKAQEERENVEEPSHLPAVEEAVPAPSKRATRSRRGKRQMEEAQDAEMQKGMGVLDFNQLCLFSMQLTNTPSHCRRNHDRDPHRNSIST